MSIVNNNENLNNNQANCNDRNSDFRLKRESTSFFDENENENVNFATPLINNAQDVDDGLKICKNITLNGLLITAGKF